MFKICVVCDFEWHIKDGSKCPACSDRENKDVEEEFCQYRGGAFGTSKNHSHFKNWYKAIGIIALVLILYAFMIG